MTQPMFGLIPRPTSLETIGGEFVLSSPLVIACDEGAEQCADLLVEYLRVTGLDVAVGGDTATVHLRLDGSQADARPEGYRLEVTDHGVVIAAPAVGGLLHGIQTLRQLLPTEIYGTEPSPDVRWRVPCVRISDAPRLGWRGSLLDVGRYFMPLDYLYRYVDTLAMHKMNRFHLHLTEDQGWRVEVNRYPELTRVGAWRRESEIGAPGEHRTDATPHGGFYTQDELRALVRFAARRGIEVVPEIDMPGHMTAAIAAYPELGNSAEHLEVSDHWGIHDTVLNLEEPTFAFLHNVLDEMLDIFPSQWVHIGGDECPTVEWQASDAAQRRVRELGLEGVWQLQEWFTNRICAYLISRGRTPVVWDEAASANLSREVIVMAWRDARLGIAAAERGHRVVMAPVHATYFDLYQSDAPGEPLAQPGLVTLGTAYDYDATPDGLAADVRDRILGTQGQLWTEYLPTPERVDGMAFPRMCALAERAWATTPPDYADFLSRMPTHGRRLSTAGLHMTHPPQ